MKRLGFSSLMLAFTLAAAPTYAQKTEPAAKAEGGVSVRGKIVRMDGPDRFVVRTTGDKEVTLYTTRDTRYLRGGKVIRFADLSVGADITSGYVVRDGRYYVDTVTLGAAVDEPAGKTVADDASVRGTIMGIRAPDEVMVRTDRDKEVTLRATATTRVQINGKEARFGDLKIGMELVAALARDGDRVFITAITVGGAKSPAAVDGTIVEGKVIRVLGEDQIIVAGPDGKEIAVYVNPKTTYTFDDRPGRFVDVRSGVPVRVTYDAREGRFYARSVFGLRRR